MYIVLNVSYIGLKKYPKFEYQMIVIWFQLNLQAVILDFLQYLMQVYRWWLVRYVLTKSWRLNTGIYFFLY